jgi:hypothetical protein
VACEKESQRRPVVVFGGMVGMLGAQKKYDAAIRLEQLWNELALTCSFFSAVRTHPMHFGTGWPSPITLNFVPSTLTWFLRYRLS